MFANQYYTLTGDIAFQYYPERSRADTTNASPVSASTVKNWIRLNDSIDADDETVNTLINAVTTQIENYTSADVRVKTRTSYWSRPKSVIALPVYPVTAVSNVYSIDNDGVETVLASTAYTVFGLDKKVIRIKTSVNQVKVTYTSGYTVCPDPIKKAIVQEVALQYKNRQDPDVPTISTGTISLEAKHLLVGGGFYDYNR